MLSSVLLDSNIISFQPTFQFKFKNPLSKNVARLVFATPENMGNSHTPYDLSEFIRIFMFLWPAYKNKHTQWRTDRLGDRKSDGHTAALRTHIHAFQKQAEKCAQHFTTHCKSRQNSYVAFLHFPASVDMCYCTRRLQKSGISHHIILPPRTEILGRLHTSVKVTILRIPVTRTADHPPYTGKPNTMSPDRRTDIHLNALCKSTLQKIRKKD